MKILITGCSGFVGRALSRACLTSGETVYGLSGQPQRCEPGVVVWRTAGPDFVDLEKIWPTGASVDTVVHLAARVHQRHETTQSPDALLAAYRETNVAASLRVAKAAAAAGATRFIFVSSIKAMGETEPGTPGHPWSEGDTPRPSDPYGISKLEAEEALRGLCAQRKLDLVIIRPPLVYGPGVRANFLQLLSLVRRGLPLPLGAVEAQRSMIFIDNLVSAILAATRHPAAPGHALLVSDGQDLTVAQIVSELAGGMGCRARLFSLPPGLLAIAARLTGKEEQADRLLQPLRVNIDAISTKLGWKPPVSAQIGLHRTAIWYRDELVPQS